ncbi:hypothetical protein HMPREF0880_01277 [Yokenella regensburgei ATCC 43003]|nr:hypothetical protein HMPREF0880_01277 [Yokenella regensburgei ATCC 43003]
MPLKRWRPQPGAKAAGIGVAQHFAVAEHQVNMVMLLCGEFSGQNAQAPGHSKMNDYPAVRQFEQQVFRAALHAQYRFITQAMDFVGNGPAKPSVTDNSVQNGCANQMGFNTTAAGLNLG